MVVEGGTVNIAIFGADGGEVLRPPQASTLLRRRFGVRGRARSPQTAVFGPSCAAAPVGKIKGVAE